MGEVTLCLIMAGALWVGYQIHKSPGYSHPEIARKLKEWEELREQNRNQNW